MQTENRKGDLARRWLKACQSALELTRQQKEAVAAGDYPRLAALVAERGQIFAALGDLREVEQRGGHEAWEEVGRLLEEIARLDGENQRAIAAHMASLRQSLKGIGQWRQAARAYGGGQDIPDKGIEV